MKSIKKLFNTITRPFTRKPLRKYVPYRINYHERYMLPPLAFFVGIFMVVYGHHKPFGYFLGMWEFYVAAAPSVGTAWVALWCVTKITGWLDTRYTWLHGWWPRPFRRLLLQLALGLALPALAILGIFVLYFTCWGRMDLIPRYVIEDFPFVLLMLAGFNGLLWCYFLLRVDEILEKILKWRRDRPDDPDAAGTLAPGVERIPYGEKVKGLIALYEPVSGENFSLAIGFDGKPDRQPRTLLDIYADVEGEHYFMVRRNLILNRAAIAKVEATARGLFVTLDKPRRGEVVRVADGKREAFLAWYAHPSPGTHPRDE